jgi:hypothetical protein
LFTSLFQDKEVNGFGQSPIEKMKKRFFETQLIILMIRIPIDMNYLFKIKIIIPLLFFDCGKTQPYFCSSFINLSSSQGKPFRPK